LGENEVMKNIIPNEINDLLNKIAQELKDLLKNNFIGFYVHGSIAMRCFNFQESDVDFLIVVKDSLDKQTKQRIINSLLKVTDKAPSKGLEMSVIKQSELNDFKYPTPFELHFSNSHIEKYRTDPEYICSDDVDPDLAAHIVIVKKRGVCLLGDEISQVFPDIPIKFYLKSILKDSLNSLEDISKGPDEGLCDVPLYAVLNLCRVIAFIKEEKILSKLEGGEWALKKMPKKYHFVIEQALNKYLSKPRKKVQGDTLKELGCYAKLVFDEAEKHRKSRKTVT
jgi:predicted nucleotidyltransferase